MKSGEKPREMTNFQLPTVSLAPPSDPDRRRSLRVLSMVGELHKAGYQKLRVAAGMSPSGVHWRCHITHVNNVGANGWEPTNWFQGVINYSSADGNQFFGWTDAPDKNARELAQLFIERFEEVSQLGLGLDYEYAGWFTAVLGKAENGELPIFFSDSDEPSRNSIQPPMIRR